MWESGEVVWDLGVLGFSQGDSTASPGIRHVTLTRAVSGFRRDYHFCRFLLRGAGSDDSLSFSLDEQVNGDDSPVVLLGYSLSSSVKITLQHKCNM